MRQEKATFCVIWVLFANPTIPDFLKRDSDLEAKRATFCVIWVVRSAKISDAVETVFLSDVLISFF